MNDSQIAMSPNKIVQYLKKPSSEFTKQDLIKFIEDNNIGLVNFRYVGGDARLKTLNFVINSKAQLDKLLSAGERVDGSSLFSYIDAASSDLYVIPKYKTAFVSPFASIPTVEILCSYYTKDGVPLPSAPENILKKAHKALYDSTGYNLEAMGELEYYVVHDKQDLYPNRPQRGYHAAAPFCKWEMLRYEAMQAIAQTGGKIKYGHSEVGHIFQDNSEMEQNEIEFVPVDIEDAADQIVVAKWALRMIGYKYGAVVSFAPKIVVGHAGSGLHVHTRLVKDGKNVLVEGDGLSDLAKRNIAGYLSMASSLTAFGNTVPTSYLRLVPHQEAPTTICWGDRNRSVLVRVPLGWLGVNNMVKDANPLEDSDATSFAENQTIEFRCPDGSANSHLLLAGLAVAARHGLEMENSLETAKRLYVDVNIFHSEHKAISDSLPQLPTSCWESSECLAKDRAIYEKHGVFPEVAIDGLINMLRSYDDKDLSEKYYGKADEINKLVAEHFHCS